MAYDTGFSRRSASEREIQPVAIASVDPATRYAVGVTRVRTTVNINCAYATGDTITTPAVGEQWYVERFDGEWRLYGRIPFNDATLNIEPEAGQVSVGSASGPLELNGTEVRANNVFRLGGVYYRDDGETLQRSTDKVSWQPLAAAGVAEVVLQLARAFNGFTGTDLAAGLASLKDWGGIVNLVTKNFDLFWTALCDNPLVDGFKRLGLGASDPARVVDGIQNFANYLFGTLFCDFTGDVDPQTILARLRDLLAPITQNPFILGLQQVADLLGLSHGNLLNDAIEGVTGFLKLLFDIVTCNWSEIPLPALGDILGLAGDGPFSPASIVAAVFGVFDFLGNPNTPVGQFVAGLQDFLGAIGETTGNLLKDAIGGVVEFASTLFGLVTCDPAALAAAVGLTAGVSAPGDVLKVVGDVLTALTDNPFVQGLRDFAEAMGVQFTNLLDGAVLGAVEMLRTLVELLTCGLSGGQAASLATVVAGFSAGTFNPAWVFKTLGDLVTLFTNNPVVKMITDGAAAAFGVTGNLATKLLGGLTGSVNWTLKVLKTFLPFVPWTAILPFVDWAAVNATNLPDLAGLITGFDPLAIFSPLDTLLGGTFTNFIKNVSTVFSGMGLFGDTGDFNVENAVQYLLTNILGILNEGGEFIFTVTASTLTGLTEWVRDNVLNGLMPSQFLANLTSLFGAANPLSTAFSIGAAATDFLNNIATQLTAWVTTNVLGGVAPTAFLANLGTLFGSANPLSTAFSAAGAVTAFLNNITTQLRNWVTTNVLNGLTPSQFLSNLTSLFGSANPLSSAFSVASAATAFLNSIATQLTDWIRTNILNLPGTGPVAGFFAGLNPFDPNFAQTGLIGQITQAIFGGNVNVSTLDDLKNFLPDLVHSITGDPSKTTLGALKTFFSNNVLTNLGTVPASIIEGTLPATILSALPVGMLSKINPNLLSLGRFNHDMAIEAGEGWSWDPVTTHDATEGALRLDLTAQPGQVRELMSEQDVQIAAGDLIEASVWIKTSGVSTTSTPFRLTLLPFVGDTPQDVVLIPDAASNGSGSWVQFGGKYKVPTGSAWTSVRLIMQADPGVSSGVVWWDDVYMSKTGLVGQALVDQLIPAWETLHNAIFPPGTPLPDFTGIANGVVGAVTNIGTQIASAAGTALTNGLTAIGQIGTLGGQLFSGFTNFVQTGINNLGNFIAKIGTGIVDGIGSTLSGLIGGVHYTMTRGRSAANFNLSNQPAPIVAGTPVVEETFPMPRTVPEMVQSIEAVVTTTYDTSFTTNTHSEFWNTPRDIPAWVGAQTDDVSFPQTLIDGNAVSTPPLGKMVLIPVTAQQNRNYDAIRIGLKSTSGVFNMTNLYVGIYDVDETTGNCTKVVGDELGVNGDVRAFLDPNYDIQTIPIGSNVGGVIRSVSTTGGVATLNLSTAPEATLVGKSVVVAGIATAGYNGIKTITDVVNTVPTGGDVHYYNTNMLLHGEAPDVFPTGGATSTFMDSSLVGGTLASSGVVYSTAQKKFGTSSLYFNGSSYGSRAAGPNQQLGAADFTIEGWLRPTAYPPSTGQNRSAGIYSLQATQNYGGWENWAHGIIMGSTGDLYYGMNTSNAEAGRKSVYAPAGSVPLNTWTHFAVVRSKGTLKMYINGVETGSSDIGAVRINSFASGNGVELVGLYQDATPLTFYYTGYMDEFRITRNVARYTTGFTPQSAPWGDSDTAPTYQVKYDSAGTSGVGVTTQYGLVTLPSPKSVKGGELYYVGVLQVGGSANGMHYWNKTGEITTGQFPRYIGSYYDSVGAIGSTMIGALPEYVNNGNVATGDKYWGSLGAYKPYVAKGSVFYSDSFNRVVGDPIGVSWTNRYGNAMTIGQTSDLVVSTPYTDNYVQ